MLYEKEFFDHLRSTGKSDGTIRTYRPMLARLRRYLQRRGIEDVSAISETDVHAFAKSIEDEPLSTERVYRLLLCLKRYFTFLEKSGFIYLSPAATLRLPKFVRHHHRALIETEIMQLLAAVRTDTPLCLRGKAILELAYSSALRPREIRALRICDIDFAGGKLFIEQSKNKKDRIVPFGKVALLWLGRYLADVRPKFIKDDTHDFVFISLVTGKPLSSRGLALAVSEAFVQSGIDPIPLYGLRATAATNLLDHGMNVVHIGKFLGHTSIGTTQMYLHTKQRELAGVVTAAHPRNRIKGRRIQEYDP